MKSIGRLLLTLLLVRGIEGLFPPDPIGADNATFSVNPQNRPGSATDTHSCSQVRPVPAHLRSPRHMWPKGLDQFYQKYTEAYGIPVLGSNRLSDDALRRACYTVRFLFADRADVRQSYYKAFGRFALMATTEVTTHIPEHRDLGPGWNQRARGLGATLFRPVSTGGEENALCHSDDRYRIEDILLHEFSHGVHLVGVMPADPTFDRRLKAQYNAARSAGLWRGTYALTNDHEYWAEGAQSFFNVNGFANPPNGIHNHVNTNEKLRGYDPGLYKLLQEVFPCGNQYIKRCDKNRAAEENQKLCGKGGGGDGGCKDDHANCQGWASEGKCVINSTWMLQNCKKSCFVCRP